MATAAARKPTTGYFEPIKSLATLRQAIGEGRVNFTAYRIPERISHREARLRFIQCVIENETRYAQIVRFDRTTPIVRPVSETLRHLERERHLPASNSLIFLFTD